MTASESDVSDHRPILRGPKPISKGPLLKGPVLRGQTKRSWTRTEEETTGSAARQWKRPETNEEKEERLAKKLRLKKLKQSTTTHGKHQWNREKERPEYVTNLPKHVAKRSKEISKPRQSQPSLAHKPPRSSPMRHGKHQWKREDSDETAKPIMSQTKANNNSRKRPPPRKPSATLRSKTAKRVALPESEQGLTDFAYRETFSREKVGTYRRNGLVRLATKPLCPVYRRGDVCDDPHCTRRHDVPPEQATPICLFYQNNGMCLREPCPFRHVQVDPTAGVCTEFSKLGYCTNANCRQWHVWKKQSKVVE